MRERLGRMRYAEAVGHGTADRKWQCRGDLQEPVGLRMKRPGARWKDKTGEEVLQLRGLMLSDRWAQAMNRALKPLAKPVRVGSSWGARAAA
jgi:hypothetical protein